MRRGSARGPARRTFGVIPRRDGPSDEGRGACAMRYAAATGFCGGDSRSSLMMNETGARRRRSNPVSAVRWWCALLACVVGAAATTAGCAGARGGLPVERRAGRARRSRRHGDAHGAAGRAGGAQGDGRSGSGRSDRHHLVGPRGQGRRDSSRDARRRWESPGCRRSGRGRGPSAAGDLRRHGCGPRQPHLRGGAAGGEPGCGAGAEARRAGHRHCGRVGCGGAGGRRPPIDRRGPRRSGEKPTAGRASWFRSTRRPVR